MRALLDVKVLVAQPRLLVRFHQLAEPACLRWDRVLGARHITDVYLLALVVAREGRLVTFDRGITVDAVPGAMKRQRVTLG